MVDRSKKGGTGRHLALPGRIDYLHEVERRLASYDASQGGACAVVFFNIRRFRSFNFRRGNMEGDLLLGRFTDLLLAIFRDGYVAHVGDDHFAVISGGDIDQLVEKVVEDFLSVYGHEGLSVNVGICPLGDGSVAASVVCERARAACEFIREAGNVHVCHFDDELQRKIEIADYVTSTIDEAVEKGYIQVYYQPVVRTVSGAVCGAEALARWIDPTYGFLPPNYFIGPLEESWQIHKLDLCVIEGICKDLRQVIDCGMDVVPVSFNVSRLDFLECDIFARVESILRRYDIPQSLINVEITESFFLEGTDAVSQAMARFHKAGYQVWMDDFGSGYSSLNVLKDYQFDELKIDMVFLSSFTERTRAILTSVVEMAKKIGIQTLAEGVETKEQYDFLKSIGCEKIQGYYVSKPLARDAVLEFMARPTVALEPGDMRDYYDALGAINLITDKPLALLEDDGSCVRFIYNNAEYDEVLGAVGSYGILQEEENINAGASSVSRMLRSFLDSACKQGEGVTLDYTLNEQYMRAKVKLAAVAGKRRALCVELVNLTQSEEENKAYCDEHDRTYRMLYQMYDVLYLYDVSADRLKFVSRQIFARRFGADGQGIVGVWDMIDEIAENHMHPDDRERFRDWADPARIVKRIAEGGGRVITNYFRSIDTQGNYIWKSHDAMLLPKEDGVVYLYAIKPASLERADIAERLTAVL